MRHEGRRSCSRHLSECGCRSPVMSARMLHPLHTAASSAALSVGRWRNGSRFGDVAADLRVAFGLVVSGPEVGVSLSRSREVDESQLLSSGQGRRQRSESLWTYG